jgi:hypothetical protein
LPPAEPRRPTASGARELAAVSSFGGAEPIRLPFDLQRSNLFLLLIALATMAMAALAAALGPAIGIGLIIGIGIAFAVALRPMLGLVMLAALAPATSGIARGLPVPGLRLSEILAGGIGARCAGPRSTGSRSCTPSRRSRSAATTS